MANPITGAAAALQYQISQVINRIFGAPQVAPAPAAPPARVIPEPPTVATINDPQGRGYPDAQYVQAMFRQWDDLFRLNVARQRRYRDYDDMDTDQLAALLDSVVDASLISDDGETFSFKVQAKAKYQTVIDDINEALNLQHEIRDILRDTLKYGDNFIGLIFDEYFNIRGFDNPPPGQIFVNTDDRLRLLTGTEDIGGLAIPRAYQQKTLGSRVVAGWQPWEMFHLRFAPKRRLIYSSKSFLEDMRMAWYKIRIIEEALVLHRATRATPRNVHMLDLTGKSNQEAEAALKEYVTNVTQVKVSTDQYLRENPEVDQDFYLSTGYRQGADTKLYPSLNNVKLLDPRNTGLRLDDVNYMQSKYFSRVPSEMVGLLRDQNDISQQDIAASRFYLNLQELLTNQFLTPLYNLGLALKGYVPQKGDFQIVMPNVQVRSSWRFADAEFRASMAHANDIQNGIISRKYIAQQKYGFSDAEWTEMEKEILGEQSKFAPPPTASDAQLKMKGNKSA